MRYFTLSTTGKLASIAQKGSKSKPALYFVMDASHPNMYCINQSGNFEPNEAKSLLEFEDKDKDNADKIFYALENGYSPTVLLKVGCLDDAGFDSLARAVIEYQAHDHQVVLSENFDHRRAMFAAIASRNLSMKNGEVLMFSAAKS